MASASASIAAAETRLRTAYFGLEDMEVRAAGRFYSGLMNAVVFARMVTLSLQNMRNDVPGWQEWYAPIQEKMKGDPSMKFFVDLRNSIEKTAGEAVTMVTKITEFNDSTMSRFEPRPPGATALVIGSREYGGASGWLVPNLEGESDLYVVDLPEDIGKVTMEFSDAPEHLHGRDAREIVRDHLSKLQSLVSESKKRFG